MERDADILASIEALDNGKAFSAAKGFDVSQIPQNRNESRPRSRWSGELSRYSDGAID